MSTKKRPTRKNLIGSLFELSARWNYDLMMKVFSRNLQQYYKGRWEAFSEANNALLGVSTDELQRVVEEIREQLKGEK